MKKFRRVLYALLILLFTLFLMKDMVMGMTDIVESYYEYTTRDQTQENGRVNVEKELLPNNTDPGVDVIGLQFQNCTYRYKFKFIEKIVDTVSLGSKK